MESDQVSLAHSGKVSGLESKQDVKPQIFGTRKK